MVGTRRRKATPTDVQMVDVQEDVLPFTDVDLHSIAGDTSVEADGDRRDSELDELTPDPEYVYNREEYERPASATSQNMLYHGEERVTVESGRSRESPVSDTLGVEDSEDLDSDDVARPDSPYSKQRFNSRVGQGGIYATLIDHVKKYQNHYVATMDIEEQLIPCDQPYSDNIMYKSDETGDEKVVQIFGEVVSEHDGSLISAIGNFFPGRKDQGQSQVLDTSTVRFVIALREPTNCSRELSDLWDLQTAKLNDIRQADEENEVEKETNWYVKEWCRPYNNNEDALLVYVTTGKIYKAPNAASSGGVKRQFTTKDLKAKRGLLPDKENKPLSNALKKPDVKVGALYSCDLLPDYSGSNAYAHKTSRLHQLNLRDKYDKLIPMWEAYNYLTEGALVVIQGTMHVYINTKKKVPSKTYQINARAIRVLDETPLPVRKRFPVQLQLDPEGEGDFGSDPMASLVVPSKQSKRARLQ